MPAKSASDLQLTPRQLEIARLIAEGLTNRQVADRLFLSERTVETHITNILNKLDLNSRVQLTRWMAELPETSRHSHLTCSVACEGTPVVAAALIAAIRSGE
jgi:DNA-binding CsgD family transcriptional regulator